MDVSRLTPQQIDMQMKKERYQKQKEETATHKQHLSDRQQTQNGDGYRNLHDLLKSNFYKTTKQTIQKNRDKEVVQQKFNTALSNMSPNEVKNLNKKV
jgi:hypothetical protein